MAISKKNRIKVYEKYGGRCAYCGCKLQKGWHVDHLLPVNRELKYDSEKSRLVTGKYLKPENHCIENMNPACAPCNLLKHSMDLEGLREVIGNFINSLNSYHNQYKFAKRYGLVKETGKPVVFYFETFKTNN